MIMSMEKPSRPKRPVKPRTAAKTSQPLPRDGRPRKKSDREDHAALQAPIKKQASGNDSDARALSRRSPSLLGFFGRSRQKNQEQATVSEQQSNTWAKTPPQRSVAHTQRRRPHTNTRPADNPRVSKKRGQESVASGNTVSVGGLEISVRALFIVIMTGLLFALIMPSMYQWWRQEQEYREIVAKVEEARAKKADVERQLELWDDQDYVAAQARERLGYVRPGETQYSVVDPGPAYQDQAQIAAAADHGPARPWIQHFAILTSRADLVEHTPETGKAITNPVLADLGQSGESQTHDNQQSQQIPPVETGPEEGALPAESAVSENEPE